MRDWEADLNPSEKFEKSEQLQTLADEILEADPSLNDGDFAFTIIYTNIDSEHYGGKCKRLPDDMRFQTGNDFEILIFKPNFDRVKPEEKARIVIHELHHMMQDAHGKPVVRHHAGSYCEIPDHDEYSAGVFEQIKGRLPTLTKIPFQTTMEEQGSL